MKSLCCWQLKQCTINKTCYRIPIGISHRIVSNPVSPPVQQEKSPAFIVSCRVLCLATTWIFFHWGTMFGGKKPPKPPNIFSGISHLSMSACWLPCRLPCRNREFVCKYTNHSILVNLKFWFFLPKVSCKGSICISCGSVCILFSLLMSQPGSCLFSIGGEKAMVLKQRKMTQASDWVPLFI